MTNDPIQQLNDAKKCFPMGTPVCDLRIGSKGVVISEPFIFQTSQFEAPAICVRLAVSNSCPIIENTTYLHPIYSGSTMFWQDPLNKELM